MLILPKGLSNFEKKMEFLTEPDKKKKRRDVGYQVQKEMKPDERAPFTGWVLPKNFCPSCNRTDIIPKLGLDGTQRLNPGIIEIDEVKPDIGLVPGDVIWMWICHDCADAENWGSANLQGATDQRVLFNGTQERRLERAYEWIKAEISRGGKPLRSRGY